MVTIKEIQDITNIIVETVKPKKVYLIGSYATGEANSESDLDFLIVSGSKQLPRYERTAEIQKRLLGFPAIPIDLMMFTQEEINRKKNNPFTFIGHTLAKAKVVYEC